MAEPTSTTNSRTHQTMTTSNHSPQSNMNNTSANHQDQQRRHGDNSATATDGNAGSSRENQPKKRTRAKFSRIQLPWDNLLIGEGSPEASRESEELTRLVAKIDNIDISDAEALGTEHIRALADARIRTAKQAIEKAKNEWAFLGDEIAAIYAESNLPMPSQDVALARAEAFYKATMKACGAYHDTTSGIKSSTPLNSIGIATIQARLDWVERTRLKQLPNAELRTDIWTENKEMSPRWAPLQAENSDPVEEGSPDWKKMIDSRAARLSGTAIMSLGFMAQSQKFIDQCITLQTPLSQIENLTHEQAKIAKALLAEPGAEKDASLIGNIAQAMDAFILSGRFESKEDFLATMVLCTRMKRLQWAGWSLVANEPITPPKKTQRGLAQMAAIHRRNYTKRPSEIIDQEDSTQGFGSEGLAVGAEELQVEADSVSDHIAVYAVELFTDSAQRPFSKRRILKAAELTPEIVKKACLQIGIDIDSPKAVESMDQWVYSLPCISGNLEKRMPAFETIRDLAPDFYLAGFQCRFALVPSPRKNTGVGNNLLDLSKAGFEEACMTRFEADRALMEYMMDGHSIHAKRFIRSNQETWMRYHEGCSLSPKALERLRSTARREFAKSRLDEEAFIHNLLGLKGVQMAKMLFTHPNTHVLTQSRFDPYIPELNTVTGLMRRSSAETAAVNLGSGDDVSGDWVGGLNMFSGFPFAGTIGSPNRISDASISLWLRLLAAMAGVSDSQDTDILRQYPSFSYLRNWFAHAVQKPYEAPLVAISIVGVQGCGKGTMIQCARDMFGAKHVAHLHDSYPITSDFNNQLANKTMVIFDEAKMAVGGSNRVAAGRLKSLISEKLININRKGRDPITLKNCLRVMAMSNDDHSISLERNDRRFVCIRASSDLAGNQDFWDEFHAFWKDGGAKKVFQWLSEQDISEFDPVRDRSRSWEHSLQVVENLSPEDRLCVNLMRAEGRLALNMNSRGEYSGTTSLKQEMYRRQDGTLLTEAEEGAEPVSMFCVGNISKLHAQLTSTRSTRLPLADLENLIETNFKINDPRFGAKKTLGELKSCGYSMPWEHAMMALSESLGVCVEAMVQPASIMAAKNHFSDDLPPLPLLGQTQTLEAYRLAEVHANIQSMDSHVLNRFAKESAELSHAIAEQMTEISTAAPESAEEKREFLAAVAEKAEAVSKGVNELAQNVRQVAQRHLVSIAKRGRFMMRSKEFSEAIQYLVERVKKPLMEAQMGLLGILSPATA